MRKYILILLTTLLFVSCNFWGGHKPIIEANPGLDKQFSHRFLGLEIPKNDTELKEKQPKVNEILAKYKADVDRLDALPVEKRGNERLSDAEFFYADARALALSFGFTVPKE